MHSNCIDYVKIVFVQTDKLSNSWTILGNFREVYLCLDNSSLDKSWTILDEFEQIHEKFAKEN